MQYHKVYSNLIIKSTNTGGIIISGYASVYDIPDKHNDIIKCYAFSNHLDPSKISLLWQHEQSEPIGRITAILEDKYGLKIEAEIAATEATTQIIEAITSGQVRGLSVGFNIIDHYHNNEGQRIITKAELIEISIVSTPANTEAQIDEIADIESEKEIVNALNKLDQMISNKLSNLI